MPSDDQPTTKTATVYTLGRSGHDASTYCKDLDSLIGFFPHLAPGDYWVRLCVVPCVPGGYRDPIEESDWGVVRIDGDGGFILRSLARYARNERDVDFRRAWANSTLPGPGRDGH